MKHEAAFPCQEILPDGMANLTPQRGMTLRDYFAAHAMQAIITGCITGQKTDDRSWLEADLWAPNVSYEIADAMLRARDKT
jgi:hypothetical protein